MLPVGRPRQWVGRTGELATIGSAVGALREGTGSVVWVEGEPGIGKSSLVAEALADSDPKWDIGWGMADPLAERVPLQVILDCLQVRMGSPDPARARAAELMRDRQLAGSDASAAGSEILAMLVDEVCATAPTVLVIDDLQWADEASLVFWHQLAISTRQLRLLLIGTCRPTPRRPQVQQVRTALARRGGTVITLGPLSGRLRAHGIRRGLRGRRSPRAATGWAALTPTEVKIATLITQGDSTADVAQRMYLSRRTVQTYISHILGKLDAKSRLEIVREAQRQGVSP